MNTVNIKKEIYYLGEKLEFIESKKIKIEDFYAYGPSIDKINEYLENGDIEELADLEEVLRAILDSKGISYEEFEKIRLEKVKKRGAFKNRIYLEGLEEKEF